jgi:hypothetical protein
MGQMGRAAPSAAGIPGRTNRKGGMPPGQPSAGILPNAPPAMAQEMPAANSKGSAPPQAPDVQTPGGFVMAPQPAAQAQPDRRAMVQALMARRGNARRAM